MNGAKNQRNRAKTQLVVNILFVVLFVLAIVLIVLSRQRPPAPKAQSDQTGTPTIRVQLYYYNRTKDIGPTGMANLSPDAVLPVEREIQRTATPTEGHASPIEDTIRLLIEGKLTNEERAAGFSTEFPHPKFKLLRADLRDGILTLSFPEIPSFTMGGAARVTLLRAQIEKTALQFPEVKEVRLDPESLFQP